QGCAVLAEETFEMRGNLAAVELVGEQWREAIARSEVLDGNDQATIRPVFGGITGPGESRPEPVDVFHGEELIPPKVLHQRPELPPRKTPCEARVEFGRTVRAHATVMQLAQERIKLRPVERHGFLGTEGLPDGQAAALALPPAHDAGVRHEVAELAPRGVTFP